MADEMDPKEIRKLNAGIERYNPNHLSELADYLDYQIENKCYDKDANLALLKLVQFGLENDSGAQASEYLNGRSDDVQEDITAWKVYCPVVFKILIKSLMQMPRSDFTLMKSLISLDYWVPSNGVMLEEENTLIGWAVFMYDLLDRCQFERFWQELAVVPERVDSFVGFYDSIRQYVCYTIGLTFQTVDLNYALKLLGLKSASEIQPWIQKQGWKQSGNDIFCGSQHEKIKTKNITEKLELSQMQEVIARGVTERGLNSGTYDE